MVNDSMRPTLVPGDRVLLGQVWANLLGNALKFSSKREKPVIEVNSISDEKEHVYFVRDNGAGFDMAYAWLRPWALLCFAPVRLS